MKTTILFITLGLIFFTTTAQAKKDFDIKTERPAYTAKEKVLFDVYNSTTGEQKFYVASAQRLEGTEWITERLDVTCPCGAKCKKKGYQILPFESIRKKWDQKTSECTPALPGTYRITILGPWSVKTKTQLYRGNSNEFIIQ